MVLRADSGSAFPGVAHVVRGAEAVARGALTWSQVELTVYPALINGVAGAVSTRDGEAFSVGAFTVSDGRIVAIDMLADPVRLRTVDLTILR